MLYPENAEATALYVVISGELRSIRQSEGGREQVLSTERAGAVLAVTSVFDGGKYYSTMVADTKAEVLWIEKAQLLAVCQQHPQILWRAVRILAQKVRNSAELIETLVFRNVDQRLAEYLLAMVPERAVGSGEQWILQLSDTRAEIANRIGSGREVVSRAFAHLQQCGLIELQGTRRVVIRDVHQLIAFAGRKQRFKQPPILELSSDIT